MQTTTLLPDVGATSVQVVEVEPGFVDAAVWGDELLTLRAAADGSGIVLRSETAGAEYPVDAPAGFASRCVGVVDDTLVIGGHAFVDGDPIDYQAGPDIVELLRHAGSEAVALASQPGIPEFEAHFYTPIELVASVIATQDLRRWTAADVSFTDGTGGSIAGVLERTGSLALDHFESSDTADSNYEARLLDARSALGGNAVYRSWTLPIDHGLIWGVASARWGDIVIVSDRHGTRAMDDRGRLAFELDDAAIYAVQPIDSEVGEVVAVGVLQESGIAETRLFQHGDEFMSIADALLVSHQVAQDIAMAAPVGKLGGVIVSPG
ncbi:hypothetical protein [Candidatus Poriferisodalis sp.]|uniref:hypothetical protein n=1 Tax=Candidatus Poriferisodalis sp. TaxID=3101277 RepID=UPI003B01770C